MKINYVLIDMENVSPENIELLDQFETEAYWKTGNV